MPVDASETDSAAQTSDTVTPAEFRALQARLTQLEDERAIITVLHRYGQAADDGDDEAWANLFAEDGIFLCLDRPGNVILHERGRPALARWLREFRANEKYITRHCVLAPVVTVDGRRAMVKSYLTRLSENADPYASPFLLLMGTYRDEMIKCEDGRWRFAQRTAQIDAPLRAP